eukprot:3318134-Pyramimonas_sp.AAC.1
MLNAGALLRPLHDAADLSDQQLSDHALLTLQIGPRHPLKSDEMPLPAFLFEHTRYPYHYDNM